MLLITPIVSLFGTEMNLVVILVPAASDGNKEISDIVENNIVFYKRM